MIEHKKRVIFYPMQLRDFVRDHGAELPIGIPVAYDTIKPERYCIVRPNRFRFYHELCGANCLSISLSQCVIFSREPHRFSTPRLELNSCAWASIRCSRSLTIGIRCSDSA